MQQTTREIAVTKALPQPQLAAGLGWDWRLLGRPYVVVPALNTLSALIYLWPDMDRLDGRILVSLLVSGLVGGSVYYMVLALTPRRKLFAIPVSALLALPLIWIHLVQFGYFRIFRSLVPSSAVDFVRQSPAGAAAHFADNFTFWEGAVCATLFVAATWYFVRAIRRGNGPLRFPHVFVALIPWAVLPLASAYPYLSLDQYALRTCLKSWRAGGRINAEFVPQRQPLPALRSQRPVNVVFFLLEGIYRDSFQVYRPEMPTSPWWAEFARKRPDEVFVAKNHFANSSATDIAVMLLYTGVAADVPMVVHKTAPLLWDYAKAADYATFAFLPFAFSWGEFETRFQDVEGHMNLDHVYHALNSGLDLVFDRSINDADVIAEAIRYQEERRWAGPFFQLVALKMPHFLGRGAGINGFTFLDDRLPAGESLLDYYNAIYHNDQLMGRFIETVPPEVLENTVIIAVSDHGEDVYGRRMRLESYFQEVALVPCWFYIPLAVQRGLDPGATANLRHNFAHIATSNQDIVPTLLDLMGLRQQQAVAALMRHLPGRSLLDRQRPTDMIVMLNTNVLRRWDREGFALTLANGTKRYVYNMGKEHFYDLTTDPLEQHNLIGTPAYEVYRRRIEDKITSSDPLLRIVRKYEPRQ